MDLKQLKALVTVAEVGSVTRAAELLHLVQPAVTRQIRTLEHELGVELFERSHTGMRLTDAGAVMVERAGRALRELGRARAEITPPPGVVGGSVTVGLLESSVDLIAGRLTTAVLNGYPGIELRILTAYSGHLQRWMDDGDLDLSLLYNLSDSPSLNVAPLVSEQLWAVATADAGLSADRPVTLAELAAHPVVMPSSGHALRVLIDAAAAKADVVFDIGVQTNSMQLQKLLVLDGHGWTILPAAGIVADVAAGRLSAAPLRQPEIRRSIVLGMPRNGRMPAAVDIVAQELARAMRTAVSEGGWLSAQWHGDPDAIEPMPPRRT
ncbi:LysR family transcriptional regulator [Nocardia macrotermitis]|uniref:HTH-type transcriptional regulator CynR n=1 Tax=Nocardia macrotermitis TaxID=2585198 RepID=A0A7K0DEC8_9NOCA|nr:LysR family transcriptional regulator [Nocardia macrotermitis]MQY24156.1 HTH-type transcriptional regulator CynR [Nocardia macrotermitis]